MQLYICTCAAMSTLAIWCRVVHSRDVSPYIFDGPAMSGLAFSVAPFLHIHCESKNWATFIFTVTLANVGRFLKFFQCRNQKEMAHNKNDKFPTVD